MVPSRFFLAQTIRREEQAGRQARGQADPRERGEQPFAQAGRASDPHPMICIHATSVPTVTFLATDSPWREEDV